MNKTKVLIVDDSAFVREILSQSLEMDPTIEVVGTAGDPYKARDKILQLNPDVLTLDVEMPRMNGLEFLQKIMQQHPLPVIMVSAFTDKGSQITLDALLAGAVDFVQKPSKDIERGLSAMIEEIQKKVKMAAHVDMSWRKKIKKVTKTKAEIIESYKSTSCKVIAIGASTGGTLALRKILEGMPKNSPGILVVQHMPPGFTRIFAERLNNLFDLDIREARSGDRILPGSVLIAPGDKHMEILRSGDECWVHCHSGPRIKGLRPAVEVLFKSVAKYAGGSAIGVLLTGMGDDGADAMVELRKTGARTMAQDEETSVVFGMPKQAYLKGGVEKLVPLEKISKHLKEYLREMSK
jgi:two-component system chemotaxis response regulator CheB